MIKDTLRMLVILLLLSACEKSEQEPAQVELKGTLKGTITTANMYGIANEDQDNVLVQLEGGDSLISATTNSAGSYEMHNIPMNTYNVIITKDGYGEMQEQGFQFVGGNAPYYFDSRIVEISDIEIQDMNLEFDDEKRLYITCTVNHSIPEDVSIFNPPRIWVYAHTDKNPSFENYSASRSDNFQVESGNRFTTALHLKDNEDFPSGSTAYVTAYGAYGYSAYYDIAKDEVMITNLGQASEIASIKVP